MSHSNVTATAILPARRRYQDRRNASYHHGRDLYHNEEWRLVAIRLSTRRETDHQRGWIASPYNRFEKGAIQLSL
jgi:hypothetical protein